MSSDRTLPVLADVTADAEHCSYCPKMCRSTCPVAGVTGRETANPWGIDRQLVAAARDGVQASSVTPAWSCTGCRGCGSACLPGLDLPTHVRALRAAVVDAGLAPSGAEIAAGGPRASDPALLAVATDGAPTTLLSGCSGDEDRALAAMLAAVGEAFDIPSEPVCCGARAADAGFAGLALERRSHVTDAVGKAEEVVVVDPHCARWLSVDGKDERVVTLTSWLAARIDALDFPGEPVRAAWHDPCWLGRGSGEYDAARTCAAAAAGAELVEPAHTRDHARCAGPGMGMDVVAPDVADAIARARADELADCGADVVVTACAQAARALAGAGLVAYNLPTFLAGRLADADIEDHL